jgi:hypothetical protein
MLLPVRRWRPRDIRSLSTDERAGRRLCVTRVTLLLAIGSLLALTTPASARSAQGEELGTLLVIQPCCNGAALMGSRAYVQLPSSPSVGPSRQVLSRVGAADSALGLAQLGIQMDNGIVVNNNPSCYVPYNTLTGFYEWWDYSTFTTRCATLGQVTTGHLYSTAKQANNKWQLFVDGTPQLASPLIEMKGSTNPNAWYVFAGGEVIWEGSATGPEPVNWNATYGGTPNNPWQRYNINPNIGWYTIQQNNGICDGPPNNCSGGAWTFSTSSFPTVWSVNH